MSLLLLLLVLPLQLQAKRTDPCQHKALDPPIVSFIVPVLVQPTVYVGSSKVTQKRNYSADYSRYKSYDVTLYYYIA